MIDELKESLPEENSFIYTSKEYLKGLESKAKDADYNAGFKAGYREAIYDLTDFVKALRKEQ